MIKKLIYVTHFFLFVVYNLLARAQAMRQATCFVGEMTRNDDKRGVLTVLLAINHEPDVSTGLTAGMMTNGGVLTVLLAINHEPDVSTGLTGDALTIVLLMINKHEVSTLNSQLG